MWRPVGAEPGPHERQTAATLGYRPSLDGLRAIAVAAVVLFHLPVAWLPGGFLGVDVFFVISGFLITSLLVAEAEARNDIGLKRFWGRRARRLLPAVWASILLTTLAAALFARDALSRLRGDVPAALGYFLNWRLIFHHDSYAEKFGRPPLLLHLWSLAIEEQFYLVWPVVVLGVLWWAFRRPGRDPIRSLAAVALGGAVLSAILMGALARPGHDPSALYFNPATHADGLLLGSALAAALPLWERREAITPGARRVLDGVGIAAAAGLVALFATLQQQNPASYWGSMQLAVVLTGLVVVVATHPGARLGGPLAAGLPVWIGRRSYAIYLWHWPIFELTRPGVDWNVPEPLATILRLALVVVLADASYRWIETPFRTRRAQRALRKWWGETVRLTVRPAPRHSLRYGRRRTLRPSLRLSVRPAVVVGVASLAGIAIAVSVFLVEAPSPWTDPELASGSTPASHLRLNVAPAPRAVLSAAAPSTTAPAAPTTVTRTPGVTGRVLAIGDSVMLGASTELSAALGPGSIIDARVDRQIDQGLSRLAQYRAAGKLDGLSAVVIGLGTNGLLDVAHCERFEREAAGVPRLVFVNVRVPRSWQDATDASLRACTAGKPGVVVANWYRASGAPGIIGPDRVHETIAGRHLYASVVAAAVRG
ncbi:MAG: acyltransferase [Acidimicrobiaceae bacterium]|nr:acyltransferase [Acidimicrobiaceae bacterium]